MENTSQHRQMNITDYDNDFAHYECGKETRKKLGQVWTPYSLICTMMDKVGTVDDPTSVWHDETKTNLDPTMGAGNIVIAMLYRRIAECSQDPLKALKNVYGVELEQKTLDYAKNRIKKFMKHFTDQDVTDIVEHNFVCSDIFFWNIDQWRQYTCEEAMDKLDWKGKYKETFEKLYGNTFKTLAEQYRKRKKKNDKLDNNTKSIGTGPFIH